MRERKTIMKKKFLLAVLMIVLCVGNCMTAFAAPQTMPDGTTFDPTYYGHTNPDVLAAVGITTEALYQHYVQFGKAEGRLPVDPNPQTFMPISVEPVIGPDGKITMRILLTNTNGQIVNQNPTYGSLAEQYAAYEAALATAQ